MFHPSPPEALCAQRRVARTEDRQLEATTPRQGLGTLKISTLIDSIIKKLILFLKL